MKVEDYFALLQDDDRTPKKQEMLSRIETDLVSGLDGMQSKNILNLLIARRTKGFVENRDTIRIEDERVIFQNVSSIFYILLYRMLLQKYPWLRM